MDRKCGLCHVLDSFVRCVLCNGGASDSNPCDSDASTLADVAPIIAQANTSMEAIFQSLPSKQESNESTMKNINKEYSSESEFIKETLKNMPASSRILGRFSTLNRQRKPFPASRYLRENSAILDDFDIGQVQRLLQQSHNWDFNVFFFNSLTGGYSLPHLGIYLFEFYGLLRHFQLDIICVRKLFVSIENGYYDSNPYHSSVHATDVMQAMHCFLLHDKIRRFVTPIEIMASIIAAAAHDIYHPGVNQSFLTATSNYLSIFYKNMSVLENHHWRCTISSIIESSIASQLEDSWPQLRDQVCSLILATDISRQRDFIFQFKECNSSNTIDMNCINNRHFILQIALKCADISNPCRTWELSRKWSKKVCEEFFRQGDYERQLSLALSNMCDRMTTSIPKIQSGFLRFFVKPLIEEWNIFMESKVTHKMLLNLIENLKRWDDFVMEELINNTMNNANDTAENDGVLDLNSAHVKEIKNGVYNNNRRSSAPMDRETKLHIIQSRRESFPCYMQYIRLEELFSFRDGVFLSHSSYSIGLDQYKKQFQNIRACENVFPKHSIATMTKNADKAIHIRNIILGDEALDIPMIDGNGSAESIKHVLHKIQSPVINKKPVDEISLEKDEEIKSDNVNSYNDKLIEYKVKTKMNIINVIKSFLMKCDSIWKKSNDDFSVSPYMSSYHLSMPCLNNLGHDLPAEKLKKTFSFPGDGKYEIKVTDNNIDNETPTFGSAKLTDIHVSFNEDIEVESVFCKVLSETKKNYASLSHDLEANNIYEEKSTEIKRYLSLPDIRKPF